MSEANDSKVIKLRKRVKVAVRRSRDLSGDVESETGDFAKKGVKGYGKDGGSRQGKGDSVVGGDERSSAKRENTGRRVRLKTKSERFGSDKRSDEFVERKNMRRETKRFSEDHYGDEKLNNRENSGSRRVKDDSVVGVDERLSSKRENAGRRVRLKTEKSERFGSDKQSEEFVERKNMRRETKRFGEDHYGDGKLNNRENSGRRGVESNNRDNRIRGGKERYGAVSHGDIELKTEKYDMKSKRIYADRNPDDESTFRENLNTSGRKNFSRAGASKFRDDMVDNRRTRRGLSHDSEQSSWKKSSAGRRISSQGESNDERGRMNSRGAGKSVNRIDIAERGGSGNGGLKIPERSKFESSKRFDQKNYTAESILVSSKKKILHKKNFTEDAATKDSRPKKKKRVFRLDPSDVSNKRIEDETATIDGAKEKKEDSDSSKNAEMSMNAQFRAIQPSPSILSFVEGNLLGRRREIEFRNAGFNIELPVPLDNIPESSERARIEEPIFRNKLEFYAAAKISSSFPPPDPAEIAFAGRSNVGKSSLLNALTRQWGVARTSDKPGLTQTINFFKLGEKISLVDLPGYGFAYAKEETKEAWEELVKEYVSTRVGLKRVCLLIDTKWGMKQTDHELIDLMERSKTKYQIILTKTDLSFPIDVARRAMQIEQNLAAKKSAVQPVMMVSSKTGAGIRSLRTVLGKAARFLKL